MDVILKIIDYLRDFNIVSILVRLVLAMLMLLSSLAVIPAGAARITTSDEQTAGMRTHIFVCLGAALTTMIGYYSLENYGTGDPLRVAAQVISGIGFLGVGTIFLKGRFQITGLTTAAGLWTSAIIGLAIGAGYYEAALIGVAIVLLAALVLSKFEYFIMASAKRMNIYVEFDSPDMLDRLVDRLEVKGIRVTDIEFTKQRTTSGVRYSAVLTLKFKKRQKHDNVLSEMSQFDGVYSVEEL
mgnify:CR=1 FL=1